MPIIKRRKIFDNDAINPQQYLSQKSRLATIESVDPLAGTCIIKWLDNPGGRNEVNLTQGMWGEYHIPIEGAIVYVDFDIYDRARIVRYANTNHSIRQLLPSEGGVGEIPKLRAGEKYWESAGGAFIYMNADGKIFFVTPTGDTIELDPNNQLIRMDSVNWKVITDSGTDEFGVIKRWASDGTHKIITDGIPTTKFPNGTPLTERRITINDFNPQFKSSVHTVEINIGTYVTDDGKILDANSNTVSPTSSAALIFRAELTDSNNNSLFVLAIDKSGKVTATSPQITLTTSNLTIASSDIRLGGSDASEHGVLGDTLVSVLQNIIGKFNGHTHSGVQTGSAFSGAPAVSISADPTTVKATDVKLK